MLASINKYAVLLMLVHISVQYVYTSGAFSVMGKASILQEILSIDREIKQLERDSTYMKIKKNLRNLEGRTTLGMNVIVASPDDLDKKIRVRKNSKEMDEIVEKYRERNEMYRGRLIQLYEKKADLTGQLFG
jgi:hypothetical protein